MEIRRILTLRGPNIWSRYPVLEAWVDLGDLNDSASDTLPGFNERLMAWLPTMIEHRCSIGERGGFFQRLKNGTYPAHILEHVTLELQTLAGTPVGFGKARETSEEGVYKVAVRYRDEQLARACLFAARELILAAIFDRPFPAEDEINKLRLLADRVCLGPSTSAIVKAAESRGIPARRLNAGSLVQLGQGARQRRIWTAETDRTSAIAECIAQDKDLTKTLLRAVGIPVPEGRPVDDPDDAWEAAQEIAAPVVVKPRDANHGRAVFTGLTAKEQIEKAFHLAAREGSGVIVERFAPGSEHRLLVVGGKLVAAARGEAAHVVGDGQQTVRELIESQLNSDPRRGEHEDCPLSPIEINEILEMLLERQDYPLTSIPPEGRRILVQRNDNLSNDVTDQVHPSVAAHVVLATQTVGLDVAGLDVVVEDISRPLEEQGGVIVEVNASPGLLMHLKPASGQPRPVGEAIVSILYPDGENGRIPIVCVTGTNGKTTVTRLITHILRATGRIVGMTCTDGISIDGRRIEVGDCSGPRSARQVLLNPHVEAAVFEAARGGLLREGLGVDRCDVAVVTNIGEADHLGSAYINTPEQMFTVKRTPVDVVLPTGTAVLKADDPLVADMAALSAGGVIFFAQDEHHAKVVEHRAAGRRAAFVSGDAFVLAEGTHDFLRVPVADIPMTHGNLVPFQIENALAAAAAAWGLGVAADVIAEGLRSFGMNAHDDPGRFNVVQAHGRTCIVDDCHNPSALVEVIRALDRFPNARRTAVYSAGDERRDEDIIRQGQLLGDAFDRVVIYEDYSASDRGPGELTALFRQGLAAGKRVSEVLEIRQQQQAVAKALSLVQSGELVLVQPEEGDIEASLQLVQQFALRQVPEANGCLMDSDERDESAASWHR